MKAILLILLLAQAGCSLAPQDPAADKLTLTSADKPLPPEACKATISFAYGPPLALRPSQTLSLHVLVKNSSAVSWPYAGQADGKYQVRLGNRWLDQRGNVIDDGRGNLSYDLHPGDQGEVAVVVTAPGTSGEYDLVFDVVQEQVRWFSDAGSATLRTKVLVQ